MFVIIFPILFYIPKFFEVHSHYETTDLKREIDCGETIKLGQMLNNSRLREKLIIHLNLTDETLANMEDLANKCKIVIDEEQRQLPEEMQNTSVRTIIVSDRMSQNPIKEQVSSTKIIDITFPPSNDTNKSMKNTTQQLTKEDMLGANFHKENNYTRIKREGKIKQKTSEPERKYTSPLLR